MSKTSTEAIEVIDVVETAEVVEVIANETSSTLDQLANKASEHVRGRYFAQRDQGIVNPIVLAQLLSVGSPTEVRPQMIYNYLRKGKFTQNPGAVGSNNTQKKVIDLGEANAFAQGYLTRKLEKERAAKERIEAELNGEANNA